MGNWKSGLSGCRNCGHELEWSPRYGKWMHKGGLNSCSVIKLGPFPEVCQCDEPETALIKRLKA